MVELPEKPKSMKELISSYGEKACHDVCKQFYTSIQKDAPTLPLFTKVWQALSSMPTESQSLEDRQITEISETKVSEVAKLELSDAPSTEEESGDGSGDEESSFELPETFDEPQAHMIASPTLGSDVSDSQKSLQPSPREVYQDAIDLKKTAIINILKQLDTTEDLIALRKKNTASQALVSEMQNLDQYMSQELSIVHNILKTHPIKDTQSMTPEELQTIDAVYQELIDRCTDLLHTIMQHLEPKAKDVGENHEAIKELLDFIE